MSQRGVVGDAPTTVGRRDSCVAVTMAVARAAAGVTPATI